MKKILLCIGLVLTAHMHGMRKEPEKIDFNKVVHNLDQYFTDLSGFFPEEVEECCSSNDYKNFLKFLKNTTVSQENKIKLLKTAEPELKKFPRIVHIGNRMLLFPSSD